jgi:hypothetical protein
MPEADKLKIQELIKEAEEISNIIAAIIINAWKGRGFLLFNFDF